MSKRRAQVESTISDFEILTINDIKETIPPIFKSDILKYSNAVRLILLDCIGKNKQVEMKTLVLMKENFMKAKFMNGFNKENPRVSIRDNYDFVTRKLIFITEMLIEYLISLQDNFVPNDMIFKMKFSFYHNMKPSDYTMYQLRNAIVFLRSNLINSFYTKELEQFYTCLKRRMIFFLFNKDYEENIKLYDISLFYDNMELTPFHYDFFESWVYHTDRKFFLVKENYYTHIGHEIKEDLLSKMIRIFKTNVSKSVVMDSVENTLCPLLPDRLILTGEKEHHMKYGLETDNNSSYGILNTYRRSSIAPYIKMINYRTGLIEEFLRKSVYYYNNINIYGNRDIVLEEISIEIASYIFRDKTGFSLTSYTIREEEILLPLSENGFCKYCYPAIVSTHRGWNLWDYENKKFINYMTFLESFIAFLFVLNIFEDNPKYRFCSERNDLLKSKKVFERIYSEFL